MLPSGASFQLKIHQNVFTVGDLLRTPLGQLTALSDHLARFQRPLAAGEGNGVETNFGVGGGEARPEGPRAGDGVLGEGTASPSPPTRGLAGAL